MVSRGASGWIDDQLSATASQYTPRDWWPSTGRTAASTTPRRHSTDAITASATTTACSSRSREFFKQAISNNDQLRQHGLGLVASSLSSGTDVGLPYGAIDYQRMLRDEAFSNFRALLQKVTLHAAMGRYLDMVNNLKPQNGVGAQRELRARADAAFSLGLYQLNNDGSVRLAATGFRSSYTQEDVENLAHVFTGWTYPTAPGQSPASINRVANVKGYMEERTAQHDFTTQPFLGSSIPGSMTQRPAPECLP